MKTTIKPLPEFRFEVNCVYGTFTISPRLTEGPVKRNSFIVHTLDCTINRINYTSNYGYFTPLGDGSVSLYIGNSNTGLSDSASRKLEEVFKNEVVPYFESINVWHLADLYKLNNEHDKLNKIIEDMETQIEEMREKQNRILNSFNEKNAIDLIKIYNGTLQPLN